MNGFSIILCCHNSVLTIGKTLDYLAKLNIPKKLSAEIILVDNNSTDSTSEIARMHWGSLKSNIQLSIISEPKRGQVFARAKGVWEAQYNLVLFCDDDNWLAPDYLERAWHIMSNHSGVGALGGKGIPKSNGAFPNWFIENQSVYACGEQYYKNGICSKRMFLWGAGLIVRTDLVLEVFSSDYPFITTGRIGKDLSSGDDVEICRRILLLGYHLYYDNSLVFYHFILQTKFTLDYLEKIKTSFQNSAPFLKLYALQIILIYGRKIFSIKGIILQILLYPLIRMRIYSTRNYILNYPKVIWDGVCPWGSDHTEYKQVKRFSKYAAQINEVRRTNY